MARRTNLKYTNEMRSYIWDRYQAGDSVWSIARSFDRPSSSIHRQLSLTGGIRPPVRKRSENSISMAEREDISRGLVAGLSIRCIASGLGRAPSTISREVSRNGGRNDYRATQANKNAWDRALRPKSCKLVKNRRLCQQVESKLRRKWSPEQIAGWLKREYPGESGPPSSFGLVEATGRYVPTSNRRQNKARRGGRITGLRSLNFLAP
jgi:transposase, IS30 family